MRSISTIILLTAMLVPVSVEASPESKLVYWGGITEQQKGEAAGRGRGSDYPFLASLKIRSKRNRAVWLGSGALIAQDWVVTAKHVASGIVQNPNGYDSKATFPDGTTRRIVEAFGHPNRDIAILKLEKPVEQIELPSVQTEAIPSLFGRDGFPMTITGANGGFIAYDVIGYSDGQKLLSPDILRAGDSGAPVIGQDADGKRIILGTLIGPYRLSNRGPNRFVRNMSYAQFAQFGGLEDWISAKMSCADAVKWDNLMDRKTPNGPLAVDRGTPEYQLNRAVFLFLENRPDDAKKIALELLPKLEGRMRESIARTLIEKCEHAEQGGAEQPAGESK